jgi:hypothetical protein
MTPSCPHIHMCRRHIVGMYVSMRADILHVSIYTAELRQVTYLFRLNDLYAQRLQEDQIRRVSPLPHPPPPPPNSSPQHTAVDSHALHIACTARKAG